MPFTSISAGWIFTLMGLLDDGRPLNQGKSPKIYHEAEDTLVGNRPVCLSILRTDMSVLLPRGGCG